MEVANNSILLLGMLLALLPHGTPTRTPESTYVLSPHTVPTGLEYRSKYHWPALSYCHPIPLSKPTPPLPICWFTAYAVMQSDNNCSWKITDSFLRTKPSDPNLGPSAAEKESSGMEKTPIPVPPPATSQQRVTQATVGIPTDSSHITNMAQGKKLLLSACMIPADEDTTLKHLIKACFNTAVLSGITKSANNHIEAIVLVIKEYEFSLIHGSIESILENSLLLAGSHLQELSKDLKLSIKDIKTSITNLKEKTCTIDVNVTKLSTTSNSIAAPALMIYASILAHASATPQFTDPLVQAHEGIRHQQVKIELKDPKTPLLSLNNR